MKKIILLLYLLSSFICEAWATDYTADADCEAAYLFTEGSGTSLDDTSSNSNTGTFASDGHPAWEASDVPTDYTNYSASFTSGDSDYIDCGSNLSPGASAFSYVQWVKSTSINSFSLSTRSSSANQGYEFLTGSASNSGVWVARIMGATAQWISGEKAGLQTGWHHLAAGASAGGTDTFYYVDGVAITTGGATTGNITNSQNLRFGRRGTTYWTGYISETAYFSKAISSVEINDMMDNGLKPVVTDSFPSRGIGRGIARGIGR